MYTEDFVTDAEDLFVCTVRPLQTSELRSEGGVPLWPWPTRAVHQNIRGKSKIREEQAGSGLRHHFCQVPHFYKAKTQRGTHVSSLLPSLPF